MAAVQKRESLHVPPPRKDRENLKIPKPFLAVLVALGFLGLSQTEAFQNATDDLGKTINQVIAQLILNTQAQSPPNSAPRTFPPEV